MKHTPFYKKHLALRARMAPFASYEMPISYSRINDEHLTVRSAVGVFDVSHMGEFRINGKEAERLVQKVTSNDISRLTAGRAQYNCMPNENAGIVDDLIVYKLDDQDYLLVVNASNIEKDWHWINSQNQFDVQMQNLSDDYALLAIQGPRATETLQKLSDVNLSDISFYHFTKGRMAGIDDVLISATGYTGSGGFEIYFSPSDADAMWDSIMKAGEEFGIKPIGLGARDTLRLEAGYCLYGNDIDDHTNPLEAGLGWVTKFVEGNDFVGRKKLEQIKKEGIKRKLVGFKMKAKGIPRHGYIIVDSEGKKIGHVTSGTMSPVLKEGIGMGYVKKEFATPGAEIFIQVRNKDLPAEVCKTPFVPLK